MHLLGILFLQMFFLILREPEPGLQGQKQKVAIAEAEAAAVKASEIAA